MDGQEFDVIETRDFITLTERGSNRPFRIPVSDVMLLGEPVTDWRTGDIARLSEEQQKMLAELDARCRAMVDAAVFRDKKLQHQRGCLAWTGFVAVIALILWWIIGHLR